MGSLTQEQVSAWAEYQQAPWGQLRLALIRAVLARHLPRPPQRVLDVGCGFGELATEFARTGSEVVASDSSEAMLAAAAARSLDVPVRWVAVEAEQAAQHFASERFDLVLCHNVLCYVANPRATCRGLATLLADGGSLSITLLNRTAEPLRLGLLLRDLDAALAQVQHDEPRRIGGALGVECRLDTLDEAMGWLEASGLRIEAVAGQLLINHYLGAADETKTTPEGYDAILRLELALSERDPYRQVAPFLHLIGRRP